MGRNLPENDAALEAREAVGATPADDWDFDALNEEARRRRKARGDGGLDAIISTVAGEAVRVVPLTTAAGSATFPAPAPGVGSSL